MSTKRRVILASVAVLAVTTAFFLWRRAPSRAAEVALPSPSSGIPESKPPAANVPTPPLTPEAEEHGSTLQRTFRTLNHNPIEFYGRAIDQFGEPVSGAEVRGNTIYNTGSSAGEKPTRTTTDAQGYFRFGGLEGQSLSIDFKKTGYEFSFNFQNTLFWYSYFEADHKRHIPDPKNPVIFRLWKKQGAGPLVHYDRTFWDVPADGTPMRINLTTGKMGEQEADMIVTLSRTPLRMRFGQMGFSWRATLDVVGGGLIGAGERDYYNLAPESGYVPHFEFAQETQNVRGPHTWRGNIAEDFFVMARGGQHYARIHTSIFATGRNTDDAVGSVRLTVWLNPNGSRNLEFDPAKAIRPKP